MKLYYWCPFFSNIATEKAVINSIVSIKKFSNNKIDPILLDVIGEWKLQKKKLEEKKIKKNDLLSFKIINYLPKYGFLKSRFSYFIVLFFSIYKLHKKLKKDEPDFIIIHLMTFIPLLLLLIFNYKTKFILRISGYPKLNYSRTFLWKIVGKKLHTITTPTKSTMNLINDLKIFPLDKVKYLPDPVLNLSDVRKKKLDKINLEPELNTEKIIISIGRLTKQKNFEFLINSFNNIIKTFPDYKLLILGDGEQKKKLKNIIKDLNLENKIFLPGYKKNIYKYLQKAKIFILTSLWEDPGFVLIEAGIMNKTILSSNCPNGPSELLENGKSGFLFESNSFDDFEKQFFSIENTKKDVLFEKKVFFKKKIKEFTLFNHFKILNKIIHTNEN